MKSLAPALLLIVAVAIADFAIGQEFSCPYQHSFSSAPAQIVQFDTDIGDSLLSLPQTVHQLLLPGTDRHFMAVGALQLAVSSL